VLFQSGVKLLLSLVAQAKRQIGASVMYCAWYREVRTVLDNGSLVSAGW
jgi:hypothetical protein